jgi:hypothetical protein
MCHTVPWHHPAGEFQLNTWLLSTS